jgi:HTH-type transcriptional regulator / antitoxin HigA
MTQQQTFEPNWLSPPGRTIDFAREKIGLSYLDFINQFGESEDQVDALIRGDLEINKLRAKKLADLIGGSTDFWIKRELQYQEDIKRLSHSNLLEDNIRWLEGIPVREMINYGWISEAKDFSSKIKNCLDFFGVSDVFEWRRKHQNLIAAVSFRTSATYDSSPKAVTAWLRKGEVEAEKIFCNQWNAKKFEDSLGQLRQLSRIKNPKIFIPRVQQICADAGVAAVIVRAPKNCKASGATRFISPQKAILQLSFRYLSDDHFWFTFFHEAGHLLLHNKDSLFIENMDIEFTDEEKEANDFSAKTLVPEEYLKEMLALDTRKYRAVMKFAKDIGVSPGVIVGQLQHMGLIRQNQLNFLKVRYKWQDVDTTL